MPKLISKVNLSSNETVVGESIRIDVETCEPIVEVKINGIPTRTNFLQFQTPGKHTVFIVATIGSELEHLEQRIIIRERAAGQPPIPIIWATLDPLHQDTVKFSIPNHGIELQHVIYHWDFGDGIQSKSESGFHDHVYLDAMERDKEVTAFHVHVNAEFMDGTVVNSVRTIGLFNLYAYNKIRKETLTPRISTRAILTVWPLYVCVLEIKNYEDEDLIFTEELVEWLSTAEISNSSRSRMVTKIGADGLLIQTLDQLSQSHPQYQSIANIIRSGPSLSRDVRPPPQVKLLVPARSTISFVRVFPSQIFGDIFGAALHLEGSGSQSNLRVIASAYIEVIKPFRLGRRVRLADANLVNTLSLVNVLNKLKGKEGVTVDDFSEFISRKSIIEKISSKSLTQFSQTTTEISLGSHAIKAANDLTESPVSVSQISNSSLSIDLSSDRIERILEFITATKTNYPMNSISEVRLGDECDPENMPADLPQGTVCQRTDEMGWRHIPGRILNARKGDVLLSPGDVGMIGALLKQVGQGYSHDGIMTKNFIEITNSTASEDWLRDHLAGVAPDGKKGTDGFDAAALKYLWPGAITQGIDESTYGEWLKSPEGKMYKLAPLSYDPSYNTVGVLVPALVLKPWPFDDSKVRPLLHKIADAAKNIRSHYRFYCFTRPEIALGPEGQAGPEAGWANGTVATACSSFVWLAAQRVHVRLEGPNVEISETDLEPKDLLAHPSAGSKMLDGLYHYSEEVRQSAANYLYNRLHEEVLKEGGWKGELFADAPDDLANQVCNTFAFDWTDGDSKDSKRWKYPGTANAVSVTDMMLWDETNPARNTGQFASVYGHVETAHYEPGYFGQVPIYRWKHVETRGSIYGRVIADIDVYGAMVELKGSSLPPFTVDSSGIFHFENVPAGQYDISAGKSENGYWHSGSLAVSIIAGKKTENVEVHLQMPPGTSRLVKVHFEIDLNRTSLEATGSGVGLADRVARVAPYHSDAFVDFTYKHHSSDLHGFIVLHIHLNPDKSIDVDWTAELRSDADEKEAEGKGADNIKEGWWRSWDNGRLAYTSTFWGGEMAYSILVSNDPI